MSENDLALDEDAIGQWLEDNLANLERYVIAALASTDIPIGLAANDR
jgi:hypothetical protein